MEKKTERFEGWYYGREFCCVNLATLRAGRRLDPRMDVVTIGNIETLHCRRPKTLRTYKNYVKRVALGEVEPDVVVWVSYGRISLKNSDPMIVTKVERPKPSAEQKARAAYAYTYAKEIRNQMLLNS